MSKKKHTAKKETNTQEEEVPKGTIILLSILSRIISQVCIVGLFILFIMGMLAFVASERQQIEFIDRWFLLKHVCQNQLYTVVAIIILIALFVIQAITGHKRRKLDKDEIKRIGENNHQLQSLLINKVSK